MESSAPPTDAVRGRTVLLIGGAGFIGHRLALRLRGLGARPVVMDPLSVNHLRAPADLDRPGVSTDLYRHIAQRRLDALSRAGVELLDHDARDIEAVSAAMTYLRPDSVVMLAAVSHASRSNADPHRAFDNGLVTLDATLEALRRHPGAHLVFASSSMVYGDFATPVVDEESPCDPLGIYGAVKFGGEALVKAHARVSGLPYTIVRPSAAYGPGCIGRRFIQASIENAICGMPLQILGDGTEGVDFTYVDDLVDGLVLVLSRPEARGEVLNITSGRATSFNDAASVVLARFPGSRVEHRPRPASVPRRGTLNIGKAQRLLGYAPRHTIETGVNETIDAYLALLAERPDLFTLSEPIINE